MGEDRFRRSPPSTAEATSDGSESDSEPSDDDSESDSKIESPRISVKRFCRPPSRMPRGDGFTAAWAPSRFRAEKKDVKADVSDAGDSSSSSSDMEDDAVDRSDDDSLGRRGGGMDWGKEE